MHLKSKRRQYEMHAPGIPKNTLKKSKFSKVLRIYRIVSKKRIKYIFNYFYSFTHTYIKTFIRRKLKKNNVHKISVISEKNVK